MFFNRCEIIRNSKDFYFINAALILTNCKSVLIFLMFKIDYRWSLNFEDTEKNSLMQNRKRLLFEALLVLFAADSNIFF